MLFLDGLIRVHCLPLFIIHHIVIGNVIYVIDSHRTSGAEEGGTFRRTLPFIHCVGLGAGSRTTWTYHRLLTVFHILAYMILN